MVKPIYTCKGGKMPFKNRQGKQVFCGRGPSREDCPDDHQCEIGRADEYAFCCPKPKRKLISIDNILYYMLFSQEN